MYYLSGAAKAKQKMNTEKNLKRFFSVFSFCIGKFDFQTFFK